MKTTTLKIHASPTVNSGSGDSFRKMLGGYWNYNYCSECPELISKSEREQTIAGEFVTVGSAAGGYIQDLYTDSEWSGSSANMLFPSIKGACRIVGDQSLFESDFHWEEWITNNFKRGVYTDTTTEMSLPFAKLHVKNIDYNNMTNYKYYNFNYDYNYYLPKYQNFVARLDDEKKIPNFYHLVHEALLSPATDEARNNKNYYLTISGAYDLSGVFSEVANLYPPEHDIQQQDISPWGHPLYVDEYSMIKGYLSGTLAGADHPLEVQNSYAMINKNIFFNSIGQDYLMLNALDKEGLMPYGIKLQTPLRINSPGPIAEMLKESAYEDMFLYYLKKRFTDDRHLLRPVPFFTTMTSTSASVDTGLLFDFTIAPEVSYAQVDLMRAPLKSLLDRDMDVPVDFNFLGTEDSDDIIGNIDDNYRYTHTMAALSFVSKLNDYLTSYGFGFSDLIGAETGLTSSEFSFKDFLNAAENSRQSEVLAYRIEKKKVYSAAGAVNRGTPPPVEQPVLQNFFFTNALEMLSSTSNRDGFSYFDTQVKYGQAYNYTMYAYVATIGYNYAYENLVYSQRVASLEYEEPSADVAYCLQFKDALRHENADYLYGTSWTSINLAAVDWGEGWSEARIARVASVQNEFLTNQYTSINEPYLADFNFILEPTIKLTEVLMYSKTITVLDHPPGEVETAAFQRMDDSQMIGFMARLDVPQKSAYPTTLNTTDEINKSAYLLSNDLIEKEISSAVSKSRVSRLEVYRKPVRPKYFDDFAPNERVASIRLNLPNTHYKLTNYVFEDKVNVNQNYYYTLRFVNENGIAGQINNITQVELISDGGYKYALFERLKASDFVTEENNQPTEIIKKLFEIVPNINQVTINQSDLDFTGNAYEQSELCKIGALDHSIFDKQFKIRLTSRKTGKRLDLNINYNLTRPKVESSFTAEPAVFELPVASLEL